MQTSNWPHGNDLGHSNYTGRIPRVSKYDGRGGFAPNSSKIPVIDAALFIAVAVAAVWAAWQVAKWIAVAA